MWICDPSYIFLDLWFWVFCFGTYCCKLCDWALIFRPIHIVGTNDFGHGLGHEAQYLGFRVEIWE